MASEMVERVARALAETNEFKWEFCCQPHWMAEARAAIEAMREPTEAMVRAGEDHVGEDAGQEIRNLPNGMWRWVWLSEKCWEVMIDAALKDEADGQ